MLAARVLAGPQCRDPLRLFNLHSRWDGAESEERPIVALYPRADSDSSIETGARDRTYNINPLPSSEPALQQSSGRGARLRRAKRESRRNHTQRLQKATVPAFGTGQMHFLSESSRSVDTKRTRISSPRAAPFEATKTLAAARDCGEPIGNRPGAPRESVAIRD